MKKICLVLVVAGLAVAGYVLVSKHYAMSKSRNVVLQGWDPTKKKDWEKSNFMNACGKTSNCKNDEWCSASQCKKKKNGGDECTYKSECKSGICKPYGGGDTLCWESENTLF